MMAPSLAEITRPVAAQLEQVDGEIIRILRPDDPVLAPLVEHVGSFQGKRLRPLLVMLAGACCGELNAAHVRIGAIVEMVHVATLVHDDILDGALVRRHLPALHVVSGVEASVLLGDYMYSSALAAAAELEDPTCTGVISRVGRTTCQGEISQVLQKSRVDLGEDEYMAIIGAKTAGLYGAAAQLGAHYGGASPAQVEQLRRCGYELGLAFQIIDDCLDLAGSEELAGKSLGSDVLHGKMTLPLIHLVSRSGPDQLQALTRVYREVDPRARKEALNRVFHLGEGLAYARRQAREKVDGARDLLQGLPPGPVLDSLQGLTRYVLERNK